MGNEITREMYTAGDHHDDDVAPRGKKQTRAGAQQQPQLGPQPLPTRGRAARLRPQSPSQTQKQQQRSLNASMNLNLNSKAANGAAEAAMTCERECCDSEEGGEDGNRGNGDNRGPLGRPVSEQEHEEDEGYNLRRQRQRHPHYYVNKKQQHLQQQVGAKSLKTHHSLGNGGKGGTIKGAKFASSKFPAVAPPKAAVEASRLRAESQRQRGRAGAGKKTAAAKSNANQRSLIAAKGRKLFSDFHEAQAEYAKRWGQSRGEEGVAGLFKTEAPRLSKAFEIIQAEAAGVTAVVFRAREIKTGQIVALKFVRIQVKGLSDESRRKDCKEEARLQRLCEHTNVVKLIDFEMGRKFAIFVLEYVKQTLLQNIVCCNENERYCERTAAKYIRDLALALKKCHEKGVVHMDVKLDNILCTEDNVAKLCDFGVAEQMLHPNSPIRRHVAAPLFAPPEVYTSGYCNTAADMWSLGVVLYILLCGYPPFKETELQERIVRARYVFPERDWSQVSVMARDLISRLLVLDIAHRYTAEQVLEHPWIEALDNPHHAPEPLHATLLTANNEGGEVFEYDHEHECVHHSECDDDHFEHDLETDHQHFGHDEENEDVESHAHSVAASAPPGAGLPSDSGIDPVELQTRIMDQLDTTNEPLPIRVTNFLRNMNRYRELEKRGFDAIPEDAFYRNLENSSSDDLSLLRSASSLPEVDDDMWLARRVNYTLFDAHTPDPSVRGGDDFPSDEASSANSSCTDTTTSSFVGSPRESADTYSGAEITLANPESLKNAISASNIASKNLNKLQLSCEPLVVPQLTEVDKTSLTVKDLYMRAKFKRRESLVSAGNITPAVLNSSATPQNEPLLQQPRILAGRPRGNSADAASQLFDLDNRSESCCHCCCEEEKYTSPSSPSGKSELPIQTPSPPPRRRRLVREKSYDIQPEEVLDWIADSEAVSCRICDTEFTLFVRKHHCRNCSNVMCDACSPHRRVLKFLEIKEPVRVCNLCAKHLPDDY